MRRVLIDTGILVSYYQRHEPLHAAVVRWFEETAAQLVTSPICIAETLWLLGDPRDPRVLEAQNHLLRAITAGAIAVPALEGRDYSRIADLNSRYADLPGDFADLTLVMLSEREGIAEILSLDSDFDVYRRFRKEPFQRIVLEP